jgi:hypothetical protein
LCVGKLEKLTAVDYSSSDTTMPLLSLSITWLSSAEVRIEESAAGSDTAEDAVETVKEESVDCFFV